MALNWVLCEKDGNVSRQRHMQRYEVLYYRHKGELV